MKKRSIRNLLKIREVQERQEKVKLAQVNQQIVQGQNALAQLQRQSASGQLDGKMSLAIVELAERAALSTAFALEYFQGERARQEGIYEERVYQRKQSEKLLDRSLNREKQKERRREQTQLDEWNAAIWAKR